MILTALVMAAIISIGLHAFLGLIRQERERLAIVSVDIPSPPDERQVNVDDMAP